MDREELENFIADLLAMGRGQLERLSGNDLWRLAQIRCEFMVAAGEDPPHIVRQRQNQRRTCHVFPVSFPHLNWDSLGTINREELDEFMDIFNNLSDEQVARIPFEDLARVYHRSDVLENGLEGSPGNTRQREGRRTTPHWGMTSEGTLDFDAIETMDREELKRFMEMFNALPGEQTIKISYEDIARLHERVHLLGASGTGRWWERQRNNPVSTFQLESCFLGRRLIVSCRLKIHDHDPGYAGKIC